MSLSGSGSANYMYTNLNMSGYEIKQVDAIIWEGSTADDYETTLNVIDPTADRTISFPNESGTVLVTGAQTGITTDYNTARKVGRDADNLIDFTTDNQVTFRVSAGDGVVFKASGEIEATSLDISGDADIDGTLEADAITVNGSTLTSVIADEATALAIALG